MNTPLRPRDFTQSESSPLLNAVHTFLTNSFVEQVNGYPELLELVLEHARAWMDKQQVKLIDDIVYANWLEDLITNFADELDDIETVVPIFSPGPITWNDADIVAHAFTPSAALLRLLLLARMGELPMAKAQEAETFCSKYGNKLDAILKTL